jgi:YVTN family beta-propeller protein
MNERFTHGSNSVDTTSATIQMLGDFRILAPGNSGWVVPRQLPGLLLALLALHPDRPWTREEIIAQIWPDTDVEAARAGLRQALYRLRQLMSQTPCDHALRVSPVVLQFDGSLLSMDTLEFQCHLQLATAEQDPAICLREIAAALDLYRGDLLPGFGNALISAERSKLRSKYEAACHQAANMLQAMGDRSLASAIAAHAADRRLCVEAPRDLVRRYGPDSPYRPLEAEETLQADPESAPRSEVESDPLNDTHHGMGPAQRAMNSEALSSGAGSNPSQRPVAWRYNALRVARSLVLMCAGAAIVLVAGRLRSDSRPARPAESPVAYLPVYNDRFGCPNAASDLVLASPAGRVFLATHSGLKSLDYLRSGGKPHLWPCTIDRLAINPASGYLYCADNQHGLIRMVRQETGQEVARFPSPSGKSCEIAFDTRGQCLWVADGSPAHISKYSAGGTRLMSADLPLRNVTRMLTSAARHRLYILGREDNAIAVMDTVSGQMIATLDTDLAPQEMALDDAGDRIYVSNSRSGTVDVFNCMTLQRLATMTIGNCPGGLALDPARSQLYVCCHDNATLAACDVRRMQVITSLTTPDNGPIHAVIDSAHRRLLISCDLEAVLISYRLP